MAQRVIIHQKDVHLLYCMSTYKDVMDKRPYPRDVEEKVFDKLSIELDGS